MEPIVRCGMRMHLKTFQCIFRIFNRSGKGQKIELNRNEAKLCAGWCFSSREEDTAKIIYFFTTKISHAFGSLFQTTVLERCIDLDIVRHPISWASSASRRRRLIILGTLRSTGREKPIEKPISIYFRPIFLSLWPRHLN